MRMNVNVVPVNSAVNTFERIVVALLALGSGVILVYLALEGPLVFSQIRYKTGDIINNQLVGQDVVNLVVLGPMLIIGGIALLLRKRVAAFLLLMTPLYLIYYALSYTIGWEWSSAAYTGNSEAYTFYFLFVLISALVILLYALAIFPKDMQGTFRKGGLAVYSILFTGFLLIFASMWIREVLEVQATGTTRGYEIAPTAFWLVRVFDLGFSIPLGLISVYLLWTRPGSSYPLQYLFYGFFLTMIVAVNAMGLVMFLNNDPTFMLRDLLVFLALFVILLIGFVYIIRGYTAKT
ncbi:MAG TPA: hypothetical protein VLT13_04875 [Bacteroidota bacterium]|nr:hypothetical protein [Bacteroidota bacterium]